MKRKNRDEESTKCSQQQCKEQLHSQATWTSGLWVLQEDGQQRTLGLGVSNGTAWTFGCLLPVPTTRLYYSVTLMGRHLLDCWEPFCLLSSLSIGLFLCWCHHHRKAYMSVCSRWGRKTPSQQRPWKSTWEFQSSPLASHNQHTSETFTK